jgi:hypothetical protein
MDLIVSLQNYLNVVTPRLRRRGCFHYSARGTVCGERAGTTDDKIILDRLIVA